MQGDVIITDGSVDFSGGVDSIKVTTIQSEKNPNGLARNQLAWLNNATVRDGGIYPRWGWQQLFKIADDGLFQGIWLYKPNNDGDPYHIASISGHIWLIPFDSEPVDLSAQFGLVNPAIPTIAHFCQAGPYLIIQAGDYGQNAGVYIPGTTDTAGNTLPLFWNGTTLVRSIGINSLAVAPGTPNVNQIPAATCMDYFMGRVFYAQGRFVNAGDITGGNAGVVLPNREDAVLNVTECPLVIGGDGFAVPSQDGNVRALTHSANIDTSVGQGRLFMSTTKGIYALNVPVTRAQWLITTTSNQPLVTVVQMNNGWVGDRCVTQVNGDLFGQSLEPSIRSLNQTMRYFGQWGNIPIAANEQRILKYNDRALLRFASGIFFDNRLLQTALPTQTDQGVIHNALIPLDFVPISGFMNQKPPNWEGMYEGLRIFQLTVGEFGGRERAFAVILSQNNTIDLWELTTHLKEDSNVNDGNRITFVIETPAFTWGDEMTLKKLVGSELWIDRLHGTVEFQMQYRPDGQACWIPWHIWKKCSPKNSAEDASNPISYPLLPCLESYFNSMTLPVPPTQCSATARPSNQAYQFQLRLIIKGFCRVRGIYLHAEAMGRKLYSNMTC
jgi:hypothetical protein